MRWGSLFPPRTTLDLVTRVEACIRGPENCSTQVVACSYLAAEKLHQDSHARKIEAELPGSDNLHNLFL